MFHVPIRNHSFDWMGERIAPLIDSDHFLGRSALSIPWDDTKPPAKLNRQGELFVLEVVVPTYSQGDLSIEVHGDMLFVSGAKTKTLPPTEKKNLIDYEIDSDRFERRFKLTPLGEQSHIEATLEDGILKIIFAKAKTEPESPIRHIEIH